MERIKDIQTIAERLRQRYYRINQTLSDGRNSK